jgi:hypothetical protein
VARWALVSADENMLFEFGHWTIAVVRAFSSAINLTGDRACPRSWLACAPRCVVFGIWTR